MGDRDLTEALEALTGSTRFDIAKPKDPVQPAKARGEKPAQTSSARNSGGTGGDKLSLGDEKTLETTDGLFTLSFPRTLKGTIEGVAVVIPVIEATP